MPVQRPLNIEHRRHAIQRKLITGSSVTTERNKGLAITKVGLWNRSSKSVAAVKLTWYLSNETNRNITLRKGQTPFISVPGGLSAKSDQEIEFPVVSFAQISKSLLKDGALNGHYRVDVAVTEIRYEDNSAWTRDETRPYKMVKAAFRESTAGDVYYDDACTACALQNCTYDSGKGSYVCGTSTNCELCTNNGDNCTNSVCKQVT